MIAKGLIDKTSRSKRQTQSMENIFADNEVIANNKTIKKKWQLQKFKILKDAENKLRELDLKLNFKESYNLEWKESKEYITKVYRTSLVHKASRDTMRIQLESIDIATDISEKASSKHIKSRNIRTAKLSTYQKSASAKKLKSNPGTCKKKVKVTLRFYRNCKRRVREEQSPVCIKTLQQ